MKMKGFMIIMQAAVLATACSNTKTNDGEDSIQSESEITAVDGMKEVPTPYAEAPVEVVDTCGLKIYYPRYSRIDLICGKMPKKEDQEVIMFVEAAFTGELLDTFQHSNIAGDHVSRGVRHKGYPCKRNNGAFVWHDGKPQFLHTNYSTAFDKAAQNNGCGFAQEMMIHKGDIVKHTRPDSNENEFRALCLIDGKVAVADSKGYVAFGQFIQDLLKAGANEALYMDMGPGWNYSWYRDQSGQAVEIHPSPTSYATNWLTFYR